MRLLVLGILLCAALAVGGVVAGCSPVASSALTSSTATQTSAVESAGAKGALMPDSTSTSVLSTTTSAEPSTTTVEMQTTTSTAQATTTSTPVEVTNESGSSMCLIKDVFTRDGKSYLVVDYVNLVHPAGSDEPGDLIVKNENPKLRTFVIPVGANLRGYLNGKQDSSITIDELKQAVAKGTVNSGGGYGCWSVQVAKGQVEFLYNDFG